MKKIRKKSSISIVASAIVLSLIFTGCGETDPDNEGNHKPDVTILQNNKTINVGTKINLTSTAVDIDGDALTYEWKFVSKPSESSATLTTTTTKRASFTADKAGKYVVQFVAKDAVDAVGKDTVTITAKEAGDVSKGCTSYTELPAYIEKDTTLDGCYKVTYNGVSVTDDALLTINPGSTIMFTSNGLFTVESDGALKAIGTAKEPILFTGEQKTAGYWDAIRFRGSNNTKNEIAHAVIEYGGGDSDGALTLKGSYGGDNRLKLSNVTFKHSASHGFKFEKRTKLDKFENITSTKNAKSAGVVDVSALDKLDSASNFTGNLGSDYIIVNGGYVPTNATWQKLTVPFLINGDIGINDNATLTLKPGVRLVFNSGKHLGTGPLGVLNAVGTAEEPILFTGKEKVAGYWNGIEIGSNSTNNILKHTIFEYAGGGSYACAIRMYAHYGDSSGSRASITDSIFRNNTGYAIYDDESEDIWYNKDIETSNTFINNSSGKVGHK